MTISYPLTLPTSIGIAQIELVAENAVAISTSPFTYRQQVVQHPGQRWRATVSIPQNIRRDIAAPWKAFLTSLKGQVGTFLLGDPDYETNRGASGTSSSWFLESGTWDLNGEWSDDIEWDYVPTPGSVTVAPRVNGNQSAGSETLAVKGFAPSETGTFLAGDYIQLGSATTAKLYKVLKDVDSDSNGELTLDIWPKLRSAASNNDVVVIKSPRGVFRLANNFSSWAIDNNSTYSITFDAVEVL